MGRAAKAINTDLMFDLLSEGMTKKDIAGILGVSAPTLDNTIERLRNQESALLKYDKVHYLDLIEVKKRLVAGVTDDKIADAPLGQIAQAYGVFAKSEQLIQGRPTEIYGLMGYLLHLEKEDIAKKQTDDAMIIEGDIEETEG
jgi:predicted transcriptional regulator